MEGVHAGGLANEKNFLRLKHDIKNQLSNIQLAIEALGFELEDKEGDARLYLDALAVSAKSIDKLLNSFE